MKIMKTLTTLALLGGTLAMTTSAQAWVYVRRPVFVAPYVAPVYHAPVVVAPTYYVAPAPVVVSAAPAPVEQPAPTPIGSISYSLPAGAKSANVNGVQYYVVGTNCYRPQFGPNGVYYQVVANPL